jgi:hypothetical protein
LSVATRIDKGAKLRVSHRIFGDGKRWNIKVSGFGNVPPVCAGIPAKRYFPCWNANSSKGWRQNIQRASVDIVEDSLGVVFVQHHERSFCTGESMVRPR